MTMSVAFKSRVDYRKQIELEEARRAGLVPAEVDENGKEINPHIPRYMSSAPWYLNANKPSLKHQRKRKSDRNDATWYERGAKIFHADKYRKGSCENCGAMTHNAKSCMERPRKIGAKWTNMGIAADEKIETIEVDYAGKRDRWNGYDPATYSRVIDRYEALDEARKNFLAKQQLKSLDKNQNGGDENEDKLFKVDEAKLDESRQLDFSKVEKRARTSDGGSTGTVRNLRIREDTAKYLLNLDVHSAHYDPKSRSMRGDPLPDADPNEKVYGGDNRERVCGQALELKQLTVHALGAFERGQYINLQAAPSHAEMLYKTYKTNKDKLVLQRQEAIFEKYGNAADTEELPRELLLGQSDRQVEYDRAGRIISKA